MTRLLHIAKSEPEPRIWVEDFKDALREIGELTLMTDGDTMDAAAVAEAIRGCDILLTGWKTTAIPASVADDRGDLKYICHVTGTPRAVIPIELIDAGIPVTNWGDAPAGRIAEGAVCLLLAILKSLPERLRVIRDGGWKPQDPFRSGLMEGLNLGLYGCGVIGWRFAEMCLPFAPVMRAFDPFAKELPPGVQRVDTLEELFDASEAVAIHAGLTDETRDSVTADLLARLPDGGVVVNTARGGIVDQDALYTELAAGRLRAALDTIDPDESPPADHPSRQWENLILSAHDIGLPRPFPTRMWSIHETAIANIRRFLAGEPLKFLLDRPRYELST